MKVSGFARVGARRYEVGGVRRLAAGMILVVGLAFGACGGGSGSADVGADPGEDPGADPGAADDGGDDTGGDEGLSDPWSEEGAGDLGGDEGLPDPGSEEGLPDPGSEEGLPDPGSEEGAGDLGGGEGLSDPGREEAGTDAPALADPIPGDLDPEVLVLPPISAPVEVVLPDGVPVRVVTLNVYGFRYATPEAIGAWLGGVQPDLAMLVEIGAEAAAEVARAGGFPYHEAGAGDAAILSRTPLSNPSEIPLVNGRGLLHATTGIAGVPFSVYCAHISWNVDGNLQARQIAREVVPADPLPHLIMAGDFNDEHYSTQNAYLEEVLADAATVAGWYPGQHITWPSTGFDETEGAQTIDLVFFRKELPAIVIDVSAANLSPVLSDHKPVVANLWFPKGDSPFPSDPFAALRDPFAGLPAPDDRPANLLVNPGAEDGLAGWAAGGDAQVVSRRLHLAPRTGVGLFTGYDVPTDLDAPWSWLSQVVDLSDRASVIDAGLGRLFVSAWVASGYRTIERDGEVSNLLTTYSDGEVVVETLDGSGAVLSRTSSGRRDTLAWHPFAAAVDAPRGTRAARLTILAHHKSQSGDANGAAFDDLYLGFGEVTGAHPVLGGALVPGGGGEPGIPDGLAQASGWALMRDFQAVGPWGITLFPPYCASGKGCYMASPRVDPEADPAIGPAALSREVDLSPFAAEVDGGRLALRWSAWLRTFSGLTSVRLALVIENADGTPWSTFLSPSLSAAEWTRVEQLTRMPPNARRVRLEVLAPLDREDDTAFADEVSLVPERVPASEASRGVR